MLNILPPEYLILNIQETQNFQKRPITSTDDINMIAMACLNLGCKSVYILGSNLCDDHYTQDYWTNGDESFWLLSQRYYNQTLNMKEVLSVNILKCLKLGYEFKDAIVIAKMVLTRAQRLQLTHQQQAKHDILLNWPEEEVDLPYLSPHPLHRAPHAFYGVDPSSIGLYPVVDSLTWIQNLIPLGVNTIQLRIKEKQGEALEYEIRKSILLAKEHQIKLFINDYWELAIQYHAYGVHLGQEDLNKADLKKMYHAGLRLGISTHCYYEIARAHAINPSYMACGPIFHTTSKIMPFKPQGLSQLMRWRRTVHYPLVAIGGINTHNIVDILATKVDGIALISAITHANDYVKNVQELLQKVTQNVT